MKKILLILALVCIPIVLFNFQDSALRIRIDINIVEMTEKDIKDYGVERSVLYDLISKRLSEANIIVDNNSDRPKFVLQIKSLPANDVLAVFIQGSFYEEATLVRNQKAIWAITWSQAGIVTGPKEAYTKNVQDESLNIINSFILDYQQKSIA